MLRKFIMIAPALAFAAPFMAAQPTMARPLAAPIEASLWGDDDDDDKGGDQIQLDVCFETQIEVNLGDDRAYECGIQKGPACVSRCSVEAVAPLCSSELGLAARSNDCIGEQVEACERQCESDGAAFCSPMKARWGDDDDDDDFQQLLDDDDDDDKGGDQDVFINIETCLSLELNQDHR